MELRDYLQLARRNWIVLVVLPVLLGAAAFAYVDTRPKEYTSVATVLVSPNDPQERAATAASGSGAGVSAERQMPVLVKVAESTDVAKAAAGIVGGGVDAATIEKSTTAAAASDANVLEIRVVTPSPSRSAAIANAVANSFIELRRQSTVQATEATIADLDTQLTDLTAEINRLEAAGEGAANKSALNAAQAEFKTISATRRQLDVDVKLKRGEASIVQEARVALTPSSRKPIEGASIGFGAGLVMAAGFALLRDLLDQRLRSRDEAEEVTGLQVLTQIPLDKRVSKNPGRLAALADPDGLVAEAVRTLRVSLRFLSLDQPLRVVLVTSAMPGDGKSTVATNLAASYAMGGFKTLLVSADLRRPQAERMTDTRNGGPGFADFLGRMAEEEELLQRRGAIVIEGDVDQPGEAPVRSKSASAGKSRVDQVAEVFPVPPKSRSRKRTVDSAPDPSVDASEMGPSSARERVGRIRGHVRRMLPIAEQSQKAAENLWVMSAGNAVANPVEILGASVAKDFFAAATEQFDMVIIDSPPVLPVADSLVLAHLVDGVVFVTSLGTTHHDHLERGVEQVRTTPARLLGLVLNRVPQTGNNAYGYYKKQ